MTCHGLEHRGDYSPGCFQDRLFSSSVVSAPILLSENRRSKTQSTRQKESRQRKANSAFEKPWLSYYLISPHETMNGSLILVIRYQSQNYGYLVNFVILFINSWGRESVPRIIAQVAQARNMSIGEHRHCCVTFKI